MSDPRDWFLPLAGDKGLRLFAFPHAGAGCAQMADLARAVGPRRVALWSVNLPGRQARLDEPPRTALADLTAELADALAGRLDRPYALFGYCAGALLAVELARVLRARGAPLPQRMVVVSSEAPDIATRPRRVADFPTDRLWAYLHDSGGVPAGMGGDDRLRAVAEPAVRADFTLLSEYRYQADLPLPVPVTVCHGTDSGIRRGALLGWRRQSTHPLDMRAVDGGYWLLDDACDELATAVAAALGAEGTR